MRVPSQPVRVLVTLLAFLASPLLTEVLLRLDGYDEAALHAELQALVDRTYGTQANRAEDEGPKGAPGAQTRQLHPYFGYEQVGGEKLLERDITHHQREDRDQFFTVAITGGSVAEIFIGNTKGASDRLIELLSADPRLEGKQVTMHRLARAGYKQPQQLAKLAYFFARGAKPDVVVNLDGLNEINLGPRNILSGMRPTFPSASHWRHLTLSTAAAAGEGLEGPKAEVYLTRKDFLALAEPALEQGQTRSAVLGRWTEKQVSEAFDRMIAAEEVYAQALAQSAPDQEGSAPRKPKDISEEESEAALEEVVTAWAEASRMMHAMCQAQGTTYVHMLQPTMHDRGSKPLTEKELQVGVGKRGWFENIQEGYDRLRARGEELVQHGVPFVDTSYLFEDVQETLYYDRAHVGRAGNLIYAERMAQEILGRL